MEWVGLAVDGTLSTCGRDKNGVLRTIWRVSRGIAPRFVECFNPAGTKVEATIFPILSCPC